MMRSWLDTARDEPEPDLHELAKRVGRLTPSWGNPSRFYHLRDELADVLHRLANGSPGTPRRPAGPSEVERRLAALARNLASEVERLRRLLATAQMRRRRRQQMPDSRQLSLRF
jgi:hypothetical protein